MFVCLCACVHRVDRRGGILIPYPHTHTHTYINNHREAAAARQRRVSSLRKQVAVKQAELGELDAWYNHLLDTFEDRCKVGVGRVDRGVGV